MEYVAATEKICRKQPIRGINQFDLNTQISRKFTYRNYLVRHASNFPLLIVSNIRKFSIFEISHFIEPSHIL
jgi:hypothetical protein